MTASSTSPPSVHQIGKHTLRVDGDLVETTLNGAMTEDDVRGITAVFESVIAQHGYICALSDSTRAGSIEPKGRRIAVEWSKRWSACCFTAVHGSSRPLRAALTLILHAARILGGKNLVIGFFETAEEGRRFLAPYRRPR